MGGPAAGWLGFGEASATWLCLGRVSGHAEAQRKVWDGLSAAAWRIAHTPVLASSGSLRTPSPLQAVPASPSRPACCPPSGGSSPFPRCPQVLAELQELMQYRQRYFEESGGAPPILALGLSSRKNLCIHPTVMGELAHGERQNEGRSGRAGGHTRARRMQRGARSRLGESQTRHCCCCCRPFTRVCSCLACHLRAHAARPCGLTPLHSAHMRPALHPRRGGLP